MNKKREIDDCRKEAAECQKCGLCRTRNNVVFGSGSPSANILFVGEAPGHNEDIKGIPFCGKAGDVLDSLLLSINLKRQDIYITNIIKCRPPKNRDPEKQEVDACSPYLQRQIEIIKPKVIGCLGRHALGYMLGKFNIRQSGSISALHGRVLEHSEDLFSTTQIAALYHPAVAVYDPGKLEMLKKDFHILTEFI